MRGLAMSQWELLVTEGHVRAARWRNAVPLVSAAAVIAVILGIVMTAYLPKAEPSNRIAEAQTALVAQRRVAIAAFLQDKGIVQAQPTNVERALTRETAPASVATLLDALNTTGRMPESVVTQNAEQFWQGAWQTGAIHAVQEGRTVLVGYFVDVATRYPGYRSEPMMQRAFGILRRGEDRQWTFYCLQIAGAQPCDAQSLDPTTIPVTMRDFIPASAFATGEQS
jgi:Tfp pilus assembly protein PilE